MFIQLADAVLCANGGYGRWRSCRWWVITAAVSCDVGPWPTGRRPAAPVRAGLPLPRSADGRLVLDVNITCWSRPDAHSLPGRIRCTCGARTSIPEWPYSIITAL